MCIPISSYKGICWKLGICITILHIKIWYRNQWLLFFTSYIVLLKILAVTNFLTTKPFQIKSFLWIQIILTRFYHQLLIYRLWSASGYYWLSPGDTIILREYCFNRRWGLSLTVPIEAKRGQRGLLGSLSGSGQSRKGQRGRRGGELWGSWEKATTQQWTCTCLMTSTPWCVLHGKTL